MEYEDEEWRNIPGYPNYIISNFGRVYNVKFDRFLKPSFEDDGYAHVQLYLNGKAINIDIHRLVAEVFIPRSNNMIEVNHIDGDKYNNYIENLEWSTKSQNRSHAFKIGLQVPYNRIPVKIIETGDVFKSLFDCAQAIEGHPTAIGQCLLGKRNKHKGYTFEYA